MERRLKPHPISNIAPVVERHKRSGRGFVVWGCGMLRQRRVRQRRRCELVFCVYVTNRMCSELGFFNLGDVKPFLGENPFYTLSAIYSFSWCFTNLLK